MMTIRRWTKPDMAFQAKWIPVHVGKCVAKCDWSLVLIRSEPIGLQAIVETGCRLTVIS
jgi:hypothetical protein